MAEKKPTDGLSVQHAKFVAAMLAHNNATKAAIAAGYAKASAHVTGHRLLKNAKVAAALSMARQNVTSPLLAEAGIDARRVLNELAILGFSDVRHFEQNPENGKLELAKDAPDGAWRAVSAVKFKTTTISQGDRTTVTHDVELRLWPKNDALRMLGEHLALFPQKLKLQVGKDPSEMTDEELAAARKAVGLKS